MQGFRPLLPLSNPTEGGGGGRDKGEEEEEDKCSLSYSDPSKPSTSITKKRYKIEGQIKRQQNSW